MPRTRRTPRVTKIVLLLARESPQTIQAIIDGLGLPRGPRHRKAYLAVHRTLARLVQSGYATRVHVDRNFETTSALAPAGEALAGEIITDVGAVAVSLQDITPFMPQVARFGTEKEPLEKTNPLGEIVVVCPNCGPMVRIPAAGAAREQNALDAGKRVLCDCGMDLTGVALAGIEEYFEEMD